MAIDRRFRDVAGNHAVRGRVRSVGPFASPRLVDAVRRSAKSWKPDRGFGAPIPGLDEAGWDDALDACGTYLANALGGDLVGFVSDMKREAMHDLREGGPSGGASATLFAIPVEGDPAAIEAMAIDPDRLAALADGLLREGVAAPGARVAFLPGCLTPSQMLLTLPGCIRRCLRLLLDAPGDGVVALDVSAAVHALLSEPPANRPRVPDEVEAMTARALIGIRVLAVDADGDVPIDYFTTFLPAAIAREFVDMDDGGAPDLRDAGEPDEPEEAPGDGDGDTDDGEGPRAASESPELDAWLSGANAAVPGVTFALPDHWARATALLGCMHLQRRLGAALARRGIPSDRVEEIHVHLSERMVSLGAMAGGRLVGPVSVPRCLLSCDPGELDLALSVYGAEVRYHEEADPFPALAA